MLARLFLIKMDKGKKLCLEIWREKMPAVKVNEVRDVLHADRRRLAAALSQTLNDLSLSDPQREEWHKRVRQIAALINQGEEALCQSCDKSN